MAVTQGNRELHIAHFNDVYNLIEQKVSNTPAGGAARFATVVRELRDDIAPKELLILFSGDFVGPSLTSCITQGAHMIEAFNTLGVRYACFGNHDFDYGYQNLKDRLKGKTDGLQLSSEVLKKNEFPETTTTWLSSNLSDGTRNDEPICPEHTKRNALFEQDGIKVGIFAVYENWLNGCSQLKRNEVLYDDMVDVARRQAAELRGKGAEFVLCLTHNTNKQDLELAKAVPEIDLILGGHDHECKRVRRSRLIKSGQEWKWLSHIQLNINAAGKTFVSAERYDVDDDVEEDPEVSAVIDHYAKLRDEFFKDEKFKMVDDMDPREDCVRFGESSLANFVCDACCEDYSAEVGDQSADICIIRGFCFSGKEKLGKGPFRLRDLFSVFPKSLSLVVIELTGPEIVEALTKCCRNLPKECGMLAHVSASLEYTVVIGQGSTPNAVENVLYEGNPINRKQKFTVAVDSDAAGQNQKEFGFSIFADAPRVVEEENAMQIQDVLLMYFAKHKDNPAKHMRQSPGEKNRMEGRIKFREIDDRPRKKQKVAN